MVTQREQGLDRLVTAREQTTETRLQANVIRRRTAREVVKREELPGAPDGDAARRCRPRSTSTTRSRPRSTWRRRWI
jgi:hypothetical protein